jgi:hypothetical protein
MWVTTLSAIQALLAVCALVPLQGAGAQRDTAATNGSSTILKFEDLGGAPYVVSTDSTSVLINGSRSLFLSGSVHYPRSTPGMWDSLMSEAKLNGLTMIEVYVFWNLHEPTRGNYDFTSGRRNLPLFLQKAAAHGLFVYLRPGPYVCAEWDYGGLPVWLHAIDGMRFRTNTAPWKAETKRCTQKLPVLLPVILQSSEPGTCRAGQVAEQGDGRRGTLPRTERRADHARAD